MNIQIKVLLTLFIGLYMTVNQSSLYAQNNRKIDSLSYCYQKSQILQEKIDIQLLLAEEYKTQIPDTAIYLSLQALQLSDSLDYPSGKYVSRRMLAQAYWGVSNYKKALYYANEAKGFLDEQNDPLEESRILRIFGLVFTELGDFEKSADYFFKNLKICEELQDTVCISSANNSIGHLFYVQKNIDKAAEYYAKSLELSRIMDNDIGIARGLNNLAIISSEKKDYRNVKKYLFEARKINAKSGMRLWEGINNLNLGAIYRDLEVYDSSIIYYLQAETIFKELHHNPLIVSNTIGISKYYLDIRQPKESVRSALEAFSLAEENDLIIVKDQAANWLYELFSKIGDKEKAFEYGLIHFRLKDSLDKENNATKLSQLELLYELDKLNQQKQIEEHRKETRYIMALISLFFIAVLIVILLLARQKLKEKNDLIAKKQLEAELEIKDKELTLNVMSLLKKNEVLTSIGDKLMEVHTGAVKDETKTAIVQIAKDIQRTTEDEIWEEFELRFSQVHSDFYEKLLEKFPNLTPSEQKLCAFLRLNMTTKEVAELTGQSISTLETARYRLRKKLNISNAQVNLISFLSRI